MLKLPNNCKCSVPCVNPSNWKTVKASTSKIWYISYRFYDPLSEKFPNGKLVIIKGMNCHKDVISRRQATAELLENELHLLQNKGYNPVNGQLITPINQEYEISPDTPFIKALRMALEKIKCEKNTRVDITGVIKYIEKSAIQLRFSDVPIGSITKKHIRLTLDHCENLKVSKTKKKTWNANQFNHYRKYLSSLFKELCELEAVEHNPVRDIAKKQTIKKIRQTPTEEERKRISEHLKTNHYNFWRFMQIFFHSGSREKELLSLQGKDVGLTRQSFKTTIKKGKQQREVEKTIKDIALPLWMELMKDCGPDQYVFSKHLQPGTEMISANQIPRRWRTHVKEKLKIRADFYSLKHLNTAETVDLLNSEMAAKMNGHTSTAMVVGIYDVKRKEREHEQLKKLGNSFSESGS